MIMDNTNMQKPNNQYIELNTQEKNSLPGIFGKCLGLEQIDPQSIQIRSPKRIPQQETKADDIISYASENLTLSGFLKSDDRGFIYLDVPDEYIYELSPFLDNPLVSIPPYFDNIYKAGAHISVVLASENHPPMLVEEDQEEIPFTITGCYFVEPENWLEVETVWFLTVDVPKLSEIRTSLNLSPKIEGHEFHITFAVKKRFLSIHDILGQSPENQSIILKNF